MNVERGTIDANKEPLFFKSVDYCISGKTDTVVSVSFFLFLDLRIPFLPWCIMVDQAWLV